jgi:hypothetical protein
MYRGASRGGINLESRMFVQVNTQAADDRSQVLMAGDRVDVFTPPLHQKLTKEQLDVQRGRLQSLMLRSSAPPSARKSGDFYWSVQERALK